MSEADAIELAKQRGPATVATLTADLRALGVVVGDTLIVHTSLSRLGWVVGGPIAVIEALEAAVGDAGTLVMPAHARARCDPADWVNPPVPESWWRTIREETPAFDPATTPSSGMGAVAETFRTLPGVLRSDHPVGSFTARGPHAAAITAEHALGEMFGERSPLGRLYELGASVLLLGVGHANNTSLHLAEARSGAPAKPNGSVVLRDGSPQWVAYDIPENDSDRFPEIGDAYAAAGGKVRVGPVGAGDGTLAPMRDLVDFGADWLVKNRSRSV